MNPRSGGDAVPLRNRIVTVVAATLGTQVVASGALALLPTIAPKVGESLKIAPAWVGYYVTLIYAGAMVASLLSGNLVRRWGAGRAAQAALGVIAVLLVAVCTFVSHVVIERSQKSLGMKK